MPVRLPDGESGPAVFLYPLVRAGPVRTSNWPGKARLRRWPNGCRMSEPTRLAVYCGPFDGGSTAKIAARLANGFVARGVALRPAGLGLPGAGPHPTGERSPLYQSRGAALRPAVGRRGRAGAMCRGRRAADAREHAALFRRGGRPPRAGPRRPLRDR